MKKIIDHIKENWIRRGFETLVVTIGILAAFTLNNWNENRKVNKLELKMLYELRDLTVKNIEMVERGIRFVRDGKESLDIALNHILENLPYVDSLDKHLSYGIRYGTYTIDYNSYETAKTYGLHLFSNDSLRLELAQVYENRLPWLSVIEGRWRDYNSITVVPTVTKLFDNSMMMGEISPLNYDELKDQNEFINILKTLQKARGADMVWLEQALDELLHLEQSLDKEIARLEG